jgi:hypothetical protein
MQVKKMAFTLTITSRKLRPYFQAHTIKFLTEYPLKKVLKKLDLSGQLINWANELSKFDIEFISWNAIQGQTLANFVAEFTSILEEPPGDNLRVIHVDGSSTKKNGSIGVVLKTLSGEQLCISIRLEFRVTNNKAEYEAVIAGLRTAQEMRTECMEI